MPQVSVSVSNTDTLLKVPAGSFHCVRYEFYSPDSQSYHRFDDYVCPNIGVIEEVNYWYPYWPTQVSITKELQSYSLK